MLRFPVLSVLRVIQLRNTFSFVPCSSSVNLVLRFRLSHHAVSTNSANSAITHHHPSQKRKGENKTAKMIISETFQSASQKLKMPSLKPIFSTTPEHGEKKTSWRSVLTLKWPELLSFEGVGRNKKEAEELAAQQAMMKLMETNIITTGGKFSFEVSSHKTLDAQSLQDLPSRNGPIPVDGVSVNLSELEAVQLKFPNYKSSLLNCFMKVSQHMKDANFIVRPAFSRIEKGNKSQWQASYNLKWPTFKEFSGIGSNRSEAEKYAILSALHWLTQNGFLHPTGYPILYSSKEFSELKNNSKSPAAIKLSPEVMNQLKNLVEDFKKLKPMLDEDRSIFERTLVPNSLIVENNDALEEFEENGELRGEEVAEFSRSSQDETNNRSLDSLTGRSSLQLSSTEVQELNERLFISAQQRIVEGNGPVIPFLPILDKRQDILDAIKRNRVIILSGGTGCGKSTQVPQYLLDSFALERKGTECNIIVTQPRRLAALSLAQTVASHRGEKVGDSVGYQVRLNSKMPNQPLGRVLFCSTGILLRRLQTCPELTGVSHLIIDEVHERDSLTDFVLVIIKDLLQSNPSLKVILMSASLNADLLSRYFGLAPLIHVEGRTYPVKKHFLSDVQLLLGSSIVSRPVDSKPIIDQAMIINLIRHIDLNKPSQGAILCFLPGWADIKNLHTKLKEFYPSEETHWILPVHSRLSQVEQERIFQRPPEGVRKIVLATNIAETSLTINDVVYVVDPGIHKEMRYNPLRGSAIMDNQWISKANVQQRAGRAGRVQPGESYHLYSREMHESFEPFPQPEILRIPLEKVIMDIKAYDENLKAVDFLSRAIEPPSQQAMNDAIEELKSIGALDEEEHLTALGRRIAPFSTHPRLSKALVYAVLFRCLDPVASIVAGLSSAREGWSVDSSAGNARAIIRNSKRNFDQCSDHLAMANLMDQFRLHRGRYEVDIFCNRVNANPKSLYFLKGVRSLLVDHLCDANLMNDRLDADDYKHPVNRNSKNDEMVKAALLIGLGDRLLRVRRGRIAKGVIKSGDLVLYSEKHGATQVSSDSVNYNGYIKADFIMYFNGVYQLERKAFSVRDTSQISRLTALVMAGNYVQHEKVGDQSLLIIDGKSQLQFSCTESEAELLVQLRDSLRETSEYLLRTAGIEQSSELAPVVGQHHGRQVEFLSQLLYRTRDEDT